MDWSIEYREKDNIVFAKTSGVMDWDSNRKFAEEVFAFARKHGSHRFLMNHQQTEADFTVLQIDDMPRMIRELGIGPEDRIAVLGNPSWDKTSDFSFFRNLSKIRSLQFQFFTDENEAVAWLKSGPPVRSKN